LRRWAKNITTPTGHGECGLPASFRERYGLKATGLSNAILTQHNLENFLQQKEEVYCTKEAEEVRAVRTAGNKGEWEVSGRTWWLELMGTIMGEWSGW
jgi:hypothetical protein